MFNCDPSPPQKTLLVTIISLLSSMGLNTADKTTLARILVLAGQTLNAEIDFEGRETAAQEQTKEEIAKLENEMAQLTKKLEQVKKRLR